MVEIRDTRIPSLQIRGPRPRIREGWEGRNRLSQQELRDHAKSIVSSLYVFSPPLGALWAQQPERGAIRWSFSFVKRTLGIRPLLVG